MKVEIQADFPSPGIFSLALSGRRPVTGHQSLFKVPVKKTHKDPQGFLETPQVLCGLVGPVIVLEVG